MELFASLFYALRYNLMGILFIGAAVYFAARKKTFWHWYVCGMILQGYSTLGTIMGIFMEPETWRTPGNYAAVALFALLALFGLLFGLHAEKKLSSSERKVLARQRAEAMLNEQKKKKK